MESQIRNTSIHSSRALFLLIGCCLLFSTHASAQVGNAAKIRMQEMDKRELQLRDIAKGNRKEPDPKRKPSWNR